MPDRFEAQRLNCMACGAKFWTNKDLRDVCRTCSSSCVCGFSKRPGDRACDDCLCEENLELRSDR